MDARAAFERDGFVVVPGHVPEVELAPALRELRIETFHRGTELTAPRGARFTIHVNFRAVDCDWITRRAWTDSANTDAWDRFVGRATPRQLELFGFPPPAHAFWTDETLEDLALRYPGIEIRRWRS